MQVPNLCETDIATTVPANILVARGASPSAGIMLTTKLYIYIFFKVFLSYLFIYFEYVLVDQTLSFKMTEQIQRDSAKLREFSVRSLSCMPQGSHHVTLISIICPIWCHSAPRMNMNRADVGQLTLQSIATSSLYFRPLRPKQNGQHFADDNSKHVF